MITTESEDGMKNEKGEGKKWWQPDEMLVLVFLKYLPFFAVIFFFAYKIGFDLGMRAVKMAFGL